LFKTCQLCCMQNTWRAHGAAILLFFFPLTKISHSLGCWQHHQETAAGCAALRTLPSSYFALASCTPRMSKCNTRKAALSTWRLWSDLQQVAQRHTLAVVHCTCPSSRHHCVAGCHFLSDWPDPNSGQTLGEPATPVVPSGALMLLQRWCQREAETARPCHNCQEAFLAHATLAEVKSKRCLCSLALWLVGKCNIIKLTSHTCPRLFPLFDGCQRTIMNCAEQQHNFVCNCMPRV